MKIAFFVDTFPSLSETFILTQITGLIDRGHEVDIYAHSPAGNPVVHSDIERYKLLDRTFYYGSLHKTMPSDKFPRLLKGMNLMVNNFHKRPAALLRSLNILKFKKRAMSLNILYTVIPFIDRIGNYDIMQCHFGYNGKLALLLKDAGVFRGKIVTSFHGYDITEYVREKGDNVYDDLFKRGDLFLPVSERWKNELTRLGCNSDKIIVHRMGVDTHKFNHSLKRPDKNHKFRVLTVARLVGKKGVKYGVLAVANTLKKYPDIEYRIAGDGPLRNDIENLVDMMKVSDNIMLLGPKSQEEIIQLMKDADIVLAPSVNSEQGGQEGIPVVLMEAMAMGVPVLSTLHSGIPELVKNGVSGFLVPEGDADSLAERLTYLIEHPELRSAMGWAGRKHVENNYDLGTLNDRLTVLYQNLLNGSLKH